MQTLKCLMIAFMAGFFVFATLSVEATSCGSAEHKAAEAAGEAKETAKDAVEESAEAVKGEVTEAAQEAVKKVELPVGE